MEGNATVSSNEKRERPSQLLEEGFPGGSVGKNLTAIAGDAGSIPGSGRFPGEGNGYPLQHSCLGNPMPEKSLVGYRPWGHKELNMTEHTHSYKSTWKDYNRAYPEMRA